MRSFSRYEKLVKQERCSPVKRTSGRFRGIRLSRSKKLTLRVFSVVMFTRKFVKICNEVLRRLSSDHGDYPNMIFATHWGLPVLSHSSFNGNKRVLY